MENYSDQEWIRLLKQGHEQACDQLWAFLVSNAQTVCWRWGLDEYLGSEAAAEAYHRIMRRGIFQFDYRSQFRSYCRRITVNEICRELQKQKRNLPAKISLDEIHEQVAAPNVNEQAGLERLLPCIRRLAAREWDVCRKYYLEGYSPDEIAAQFGIAQNHVNVLNYRARQKLLKCLQEQGYMSSDDILDGLM